MYRLVRCRFEWYLHDGCLISVTGAIFIFITASSPNRASIGATNGLSQVRLLISSLESNPCSCVWQVTVSVMRAIGPAMANSLFSLSMENGYCGGCLVYYVLLFIVFVSLYVGCLLPRHIHTDRH